MRKRFVYFESTEGGMTTFKVKNPSDLSRLYAWMSKGCEYRDICLVDWMCSAEVGEIFHHRLGCLVRLKDEKD